MSKKLKVSVILNIILVVMVIFATFCMFTGFKFMKGGDLLSITKIEMLKFFTVDSNLLLGLAAIIMLIFEVKIIKGKIESIPTWVYALKLAATVSVTLTFVVTAFYLAPFTEFGFFEFFKNANLFFHFLVPVISFISFAFIENTDKLKFKHSFLGIIPVILYAIYYATNVLTHLENGKVSYTYDFYGFVKGGTGSIIAVAAIIITMSYVFSLILWRINKKIYKE